MKKQKKQLLWMVLVLLLLVGGYFGVQKYNEVQANKEAEAVEYAIELDSSEVTEVSYNYGGVEYTFVLDGETWKYQDDKELNIIQSRITAMADAVAKVAVDSQIDNVTDLSLYGLDEPDMEITFVAGGATYQINIGDYNSMTSMDYMNMDGSNVVYTVDTTLANYFAYTLEDLIEEVEEESVSSGDAEAESEESSVTE